MSKVIAVNSGSSSLKFQLFDMPSEKVLTSGQAERIGQAMGQFTIKVNGEKHVQQLPIPDHKKAVDLLLKALVDEGIVKSLDEIKGYWKADRRFEPGITEDKRETLLAGWKDAVERTRVTR